MKRVPKTCGAICMALIGACNSSTSSSALAPGLGAAGAVNVDAGVDTGTGEQVPDSLRFVPDATLELGPKETRTLSVATTPPGSFQVRFALLAGESGSGPGDAALDTDEVGTDDAGIARVVLTAPNGPTTFRVRASVGNKLQTLQVSVTERGYTTLRVVPSYGGLRAVASWTATASAKAGATCIKLVGNPPPDGDHPGTALAGTPLTIQHVPAGVALVITVRAGHYIGGCVDQMPLSEGDGNQVLVYASDRPVNLAGTALDVSFGPSDAHPEFNALLKSSATLVENALLGGAPDDVRALLDDMRATAASAARASFDAARVANDWDDVLSLAFGKSAARRMRDPVARWLLAGATALDAPDAFSATLVPSGADARLTLSRVAGLTPKLAGFTSSYPATWSADSSDTVLLGSELSWEPSRLLTALAGAPALVDVPSASSVEAALAQNVDCALVARVLFAAGTSPGSAVYPGCDQSCAEAACTAAVASAWARARDASGNDLATLSVTATGKADVGDVAQVTNLKGSWLGQLKIGEDSAATSGPLTAVQSSTNAN